ncbi:hypothetical protein BDZ90DRAFT_230194 [Jaminaea rosea]|uniref:Ribonucleases P/MRP subunit Pop8-like domain-containing protein n=1 Tax=Jaminaea rosea TaxID=1569628 RepID=A0A316UZF0_9BASI|nr:hypothetical protein BDZ90DRAFT_230194 [Jaminaea rosea]PWN29303.1 hypothetical protein BDZ90DRAFT_230194 [Jaminaea rosea]
MSRAKKRTKVAAQSQGPFEGTSSRADSSSASTSALAGPSSTTTSKRPRPASSDEQQQSQDPAKRSRSKPPQDNDDVDEDSAQPSSSAAAPIKQSRRRLLRIQRRNLVSGATNPAGGYAYLRLRVHASSSSSNSIDASALGETFRSTLSQHLGVVGGAVPFDVLSIHSPPPAATQGTQGSRDVTRSSEALLRIPSHHAREVRTAIVLGGGARGGGAGATKLRMSLDGSQEETGSVWTLRPKGEGGAGWIKRMEEQLSAGGTA